MNSIKKTSLLLILTALVTVPLHATEQKKATLITVIKDVRTSLEQATAKAAKRIAEAIDAKNRILIGSIPKHVKATKIAEQDKVIATAKRELLKLADNAINIVDETEKQASYLSQFVSNARNFGSEAVTTAKDFYYGYSEQECLLAQAVIAELEQLKKTETNPVILKQVDNEIYKQKLISGDEMTTQKKLLIGAAITAAAIGGVMLTNYYLNKPSIPNITPSIPQTSESTPASQEPITIPENQTPEVAVTPVSDQPNVPPSHQAKIDELISEENAINKRLFEITNYLEPIEKSGQRFGAIVKPESVHKEQREYYAALDEYQENWKQSEDTKKKYDEYKERRRKLGKYGGHSFELWATDTWREEGLRNAIKRGDIPFHSPESQWWDYMNDLRDERIALKTRLRDISSEINEQQNQRQEKKNKPISLMNDQVLNNQSTSLENVLPKTQQQFTASSSEKNQSRRANKELTSDIIREMDKLEAAIEEKKALIEQIEDEEYKARDERHQLFYNRTWGPSEERTNYVRANAAYKKCEEYTDSNDVIMHDTCTALKHKKEEAEQMILDLPDGENLMIHLQTLDKLEEKNEILEKQLDNEKSELRTLKIKLDKLWEGYSH